MTTVSFLNQMKTKCKAKAKQMAALELTIYDNENHKNELKQHFGFTDKKLAKRKTELQLAIK